MNATFTSVGFLVFLLLIGVAMNISIIFQLQQSLDRQQLILDKQTAVLGNVSIIQVEQAEAAGASQIEQTEAIKAILANQKIITDLLNGSIRVPAPMP